LNYTLVETVNVKMGSECPFEPLRSISIRKATKLNMDIAFPPHSFQYGVTHSTVGLMLSGGMYLVKNKYILT